MSFIVALFTDTSTELMSGAKSRKWVHHNSTNQPTNQRPERQKENMAEYLASIFGTEKDKYVDLSHVQEC